MISRPSTTTRTSSSSSFTIISIQTLNKHRKNPHHRNRSSCHHNRSWLLMRRTRNKHLCKSFEISWNNTVTKSKSMSETFTPDLYRWSSVFLCIDIVYNFCLTETLCFCSTVPPTICHTPNCAQTNSAVIYFAISALPAIQNAPLTPPPSFWIRTRSTSSKFSHKKYTLLWCIGHRQWEEKELGPFLCFGEKMVPRTFGQTWPIKNQK